jgi:hypothetical protein
MDFMNDEIDGLLRRLGDAIDKTRDPVASGIWDKRGMHVPGRFYAHGLSAQWRAWDAWLQAQGRPGAIRDRDGGWWFPNGRRGRDYDIRSKSGHAGVADPA